MPGGFLAWIIHEPGRLQMRGAKVKLSPKYCKPF